MTTDPLRSGNKPGAANITVTRNSRSSLVFSVLLVVVLFGLALAPLWAGRAELRLFSEFFLYLGLAYLWNLLAGYAGLVSVGQQAYVGFGGYLLFALAINTGITPLMLIPVIGIAGMLIAAPVAALIFRLQGAYFAIGTWVVAEVFRLSFAQVSSLGGGSGTSLPVSVVKSIAASRSDRESLIYWTILGILILIIAVVFLFLRSRAGLALTAIRDNELAAESSGIKIWRTKFVVYVLTAGMTAILGAMIFIQKLRITPDAAFSVNDWTAFVIFIVVIGGIGTLEGPIIGTLLYFLLRETLADLGTIYLLILGVTAIVIMLFAPKGIWGFISNRFGIELFPMTRRVIFRDP